MTDGKTPEPVVEEAYGSYYDAGNRPPTLTISIGQRTEGITTLMTCYPGFFFSFVIVPGFLLWFALLPWV
jgi:hypothetical protein